MSSDNCRPDGSRPEGGSRPVPEAPRRAGADARSQPALVRPYARLPARMVEGPVVLTRAVLDVLSRPAGGAAPGGGHGSGPDAPSGRAALRVARDDMAWAGWSRAARIAAVGGVAAGLALSAVALHAGVWPSERESGPVAGRQPVPDAPSTAPPDPGVTTYVPSETPTGAPSAGGRRTPESSTRSHSYVAPADPETRAAGPSASGTRSGGGEPTENLGCSALWRVDSQWEDFTATVRVVNRTGKPARGWRVHWTWTSGQQLVKGWNAEVRQSGHTVTARSVAVNGPLPAHGEMNFGFEATGYGTPAPELGCTVW